MPGSSSIRSRCRRFGLLDLGALGDRGARVAEPLGQLVADPLELAEIEQPRLAARRIAAECQAAHLRSGHERVGELTLEAGDLCAQRPPGGALVDVR